MINIRYMHVLTNISIEDLTYMFADDLWDEQIRQDFKAGKFNRFVDCMQNQQNIPPAFAKVLYENFWDLV